jgi:hypothetical protein
MSIAGYLHMKTPCQQPRLCLGISVECCPSYSRPPVAFDSADLVSFSSYPSLSTNESRSVNSEDLPLTQWAFPNPECACHLEVMFT